MSAFALGPGAGHPAPPAPDPSDDDRLDELISLRDAAAELPRRRAGKKVSVQCVYRWTLHGCRGVRLQFTQVGATRCTTRRWLAQFFAALTRRSVENPRQETRPPQPPLRKGGSDGNFPPYKGGIEGSFERPSASCIGGSDGNFPPYEGGIEGGFERPGHCEPTPDDAGGAAR